LRTSTLFVTSYLSITSTCFYRISNGLYHRPFSSFLYLATVNSMHWLQRPYPLIESKLVRLWLALGVGMLCFLFLGIFKPFGLHDVADMGFISLFGLNATVSLLVHFFVLPAIFPARFDAAQWTISHQLIFIASILLLISILNYLVNSTVGRAISPQYGFLYFVFMTTAVGVLPVLLMTYVTESLARHQNESSAYTLTERLPPVVSLNPPLSKGTTALHIQGHNTGDAPLYMAPDDFIYACSANNYVEIQHLVDNTVCRTVLRLSLKGLQDQLLSHPQFLRCHKSYMVNKHKIKSVEGNARSLLLTFEHTDVAVPVSRSFDKALLV